MFKVLFTVKSYQFASQGMGIM